MKDHITWDELLQKYSAVCKERDELKKQLRVATQRADSLSKKLDQTLISMDDETVRANNAERELARVQKENRAKEQYIAEHMGKAHE